MKNLFETMHYTMEESTELQQMVQKLAATGMDVYLRGTKFAVSEGAGIDIQIITKIKAVLDEAQSMMPYDERTIYITGRYRGSLVLVQLFIEYGDEAATVDIKIYSTLIAVEDIKSLIQRTFKDEILPSIKWWYVGGHGETTRDYYLPKDNTVIYPEFYPDIGDPAKYIKEYIASEEAVLLIAGPPGTGKTTILRHMIHDYKLSAHVIYDERLMEKDGPFQQFLFGERRRNSRYPSDASVDDEGGDIMIIEDADTLLSAREHDGNKLMSRFLNISDGLIKMPNKKLVFTTNLTDFGNVDHALIRPGRCFGVLNTRLLNLAEAQAAAKVANLTIPTEKREWSLAELFNQGHKATIRTIGFGARH